MFQVIKYNKDSEMFTIKDSVDNSCEEINIDTLSKLESIGVSPLGFSNGSLDSSVEVVTNTKVELSDIFQNLSEGEVLAKCKEYRKLGLSDDEIFSELSKLDDSISDEYDDYDNEEEEYDDYEDEDDYEDDYEEEEDDFEEDEDDFEEDEYDDFTEEDMYPEDEETEEAFENFYLRYDEDNARFYGHLNDSQSKAFRHFSRWYTKVAFSSANSLRLKLTTQTGYKAKKTKQLIQLSGVDNWEFDGMEVGVRQGDFECSLGHKLKNCYYAINQSKLEKTGETEYIQFGIVCVKDFFDLDDNAIKGLNKATSFLMQSKDELCDIYDSKRQKKVDKTLEELKSFVKELRDNGKEQWIYDDDYELIHVYDDVIDSGLLMPKPLVYRICNNLAKVGIKDWFGYFCNDFPFDLHDKYRMNDLVWCNIDKERTIAKNTLGSDYVDAIGVFLRFYFTTVLCGEKYAYDPRYPVPYNMSETYVSYPSDGKALINKDTKFGRNVYTPKDKAFIAPYSVEKGGVSANIRDIRFDYLNRVDMSVLGEVLHNGLKNIIPIIENIKKYVNYSTTIADGVDGMSDKELSCLCKNERVKEIMGYIYGARSIARNLYSTLVLGKKKMAKIEDKITGNGITEAKEDLDSITDEIKREQEERWNSYVNNTSMEYLTKYVDNLFNHTLDRGKGLVLSDILGVYGYESKRNFTLYLSYFYRDLGGLYKVPSWVDWGKTWYAEGTMGDEIPEYVLQQIIKSLEEVWCKKKGYTNVDGGIKDIQQKLKDKEDKIEELKKFKTKREEELKGLARKTNKTFKLEQLGNLKEILTDVTENWEIDKPDDYFRFNDADKIAEDISKTVLESGKVSEKQLKHILKALYAVDDKLYIKIPEKSVGNENLKVSLDENKQMKEDIDWFIENKHKDEWKDKIDKDLGNDKDKLLAICFSVKKWGTVSDRQAKWIERIRKFRETYENK